MFILVSYLTMLRKASSATAKICGSMSPIGCPLYAEIMSGPYNGTLSYGLRATKTIPETTQQNLENFHEIQQFDSQAGRTNHICLFESSPALFLHFLIELIENIEGTLKIIHKVLY